MLPVSQYTSEQLGRYVKYEESCSKVFTCTSHLWRLYLDEHHGIICYSSKGKDEPASKNNFFRLEDIKDMSFSLSEPIIKEHSALCDAVMSLIVMSPVICEVSFPVKKQAKCSYEPGDGDTIRIIEPREITVVRDVLLQMTENTAVRMKKLFAEIEAYRNAIADFEKKDAETLFMLDEGYTNEEVKSIYRLLMKTFHPDEGYKNTKYAQKINRAYNILKTSGKS